jgi:hypothetical protein
MAAACDKFLALDPPMKTIFFLLFETRKARRPEYPAGQG